MDPVIDPDVPYVAPVDGGLFAGKMLKVNGKVPTDAVRFAVNYQLGPQLNPRDDIAIHVSPRFPEEFITRNHIENFSWGDEENSGPMPIKPGEDFSILILCESDAFKIAINGRHFAEFKHRLPFNRVTHVAIDGDVIINSVAYEVVPGGGPPRSPRVAPPPDAPVHYDRPDDGNLYPNLHPQQGPGYGPPPPGQYHAGGYGPPPVSPRGGPPPGSYVYKPDKSEEDEGIGGIGMDKIGMALGGLVAAGGVAAALHAMNKKRETEGLHDRQDSPKSESEGGGGLGNLGSLGAALAGSLASNAMRGDSHQGGYPSSGGNDMFGSLLGALGGGGGGQRSPNADALGSILGSLGGGGGGHQQHSGGDNPLGSILGALGGAGGRPAGGPDMGGLGSILGALGGGGGGGSHHQPSGGYPHGPSGGGSDLLSSIGSSLFSSALDGLKNPHEGSHSSPQQHRDSHSSHPRSQSPPRSSGGDKLTADEISKGLGFD